MKTIYQDFLTMLSTLFGLFELFLFIRLLLKFLNANAHSPVVALIYKYSDILVSPFAFIFHNFYWFGHFVEITTISAIIGYAIAMFIFIQILNLFSRE